MEKQTFKETSLICSRSAVIFNRVDKKVWERSRWRALDEKEVYKDHPWHGEYLLLHEGILQQLQENAKPNEPCEIFLFSYFIPCNYPSPKQPYRCSDLLSDYDRLQDECKITTIGYTSAHPATAKGLEEALKKLRDKGYEVIKLAKNPKDPDAVLIDDTIKDIAVHSPFTFQDVFYSCLRHTPIMQCCIDPGDQSNLDRIFSYYANYLTRNAVKNSNFGGRFLGTKPQKERMERKFQLEIPLSLGTDCPRCPGDISKRRMSLYVNTCAKKAFDMTDFFGSTDGPKLVTHEWVKYDDKWTNLYRYIQDGFWDVSRMRCLSGTSVQSLCTRTESPDRKRFKPDEEFGGSSSGISNPFSNPFAKRPRNFWKDFPRLDTTIRVERWRQNYTHIYIHTCSKHIVLAAIANNQFIEQKEIYKAIKRRSGLPKWWCRM